MALPAGSFATFEAVGNREDLTNLIANISPTDTPFWSAIGSEGVVAVKHEWQVDTLAAFGPNAQLEGDDATIQAVVPTKRIFNYCQISNKTVSVSGTQDVVSKAGRDRELAYQIVKRTKELKRDIEAAACGNNGYAVGNDTTARVAASFESWIQTNADSGVGGVVVASTNEQPNAGAQPTDGTQRPFIEDSLKNVLQKCYQQGGNPTLVIVGPFNKRAISGFTGNATRFKEAEDRRLVAAIDYYDHDFGRVTVAPSRFLRLDGAGNIGRSALVLDTEYWAKGWLRPIQMFPLAKTGDTEKREILGEWTLISRQQKSSGIVADLTTA